MTQILELQIQRRLQLVYGVRIYVYKNSLTHISSLIKTSVLVRQPVYTQIDVYTSIVTYDNICTLVTFLYSFEGVILVIRERPLSCKS